MKRLYMWVLTVALMTAFLPGKGFCQLLSWDFEAEVRIILGDDFNTIANAGLTVGTRFNGSFGYDDGITVSGSGLIDTVWDRSSVAPTWFETDLDFITRDIWNSAQWVQVIKIGDSDTADISSYHYEVTSGGSFRELISIAIKDELKPYALDVLPVNWHLIDLSSLDRPSFNYLYQVDEQLTPTKKTQFRATILSITKNPIPEPATMLLFGLGLLGLTGINRRKK